MPRTAVSKGYQKQIDPSPRMASSSSSSSSCFRSRGEVLHVVDGNDDDDDDDSSSVQVIPMHNMWSPSGVWWRDFLHFVGPGWFVSIAYIDPGNYQADIQAGATSRYSLLFVVWWSSMLSIYVQILCVRLAFYSSMTLAEAQARTATSDRMRYLNWCLAEISTVMTDLPEVIGIGIACNIFFGWDYYVGVLLSIVTTMVFLGTLHCGMRVLEVLIVAFVGVMSISLVMETNLVHPDTTEVLKGWAYGVNEMKGSDIFAITGVVGSVVMPHNLYLHTAAIQSRPVAKPHLHEAVRWCSIEPIVPILVSFLVNLSIVTIAAERVYGQDGADAVGLSDFCDYVSNLAGGCSLWAIALLAAGQSSAITTTFTGQYVMDGFLQLQIPIHVRAIVTRLVAILPCVIVSIVFPDQVNTMVNMVNSSLSLFLPFALTPLAKFNCSSVIMGPHAAKGLEKVLLYCFAIAVWLVNAFGLSIEGGGFFGDWRQSTTNPISLIVILVAETSTQFFYAWWMWKCLSANLVYTGEPVDQEEPELDIDDNNNYNNNHPEPMVPLEIPNEDTQTHDSI